MTYFEFKSRFPGWIDPEKEAEIRMFIEAVCDLSDDYDKVLQRLRATGKFKSLFGGLHAGRPTTMTPTNTNTVLSEKERREYPADFYKTILTMARDRKRLPGLAAAMSDYLGSRNPDLQSNDATTLLVPMEALISRKAQNVTTATAGGFLVANDLASQIENMLRAASVCVKSGARVLPNLRGDLSLGREVSETQFEWLHELEELSPTDSEYGVEKLTPKRLSGQTSLSTQLKAQATPDISQFIVESLSRGIGAAFDKAAIQGLGVTGEPLGLFYRTSVNSVTFGGAATWAKAISYEAQLSTANCEDESITVLAHPNVREKWRTLQRYSGSSTALWEGNMCADRQAFVTTNCPSTKLCAGNFSKMVFATWGEGSPVAVIVDPFSKKKEGKIEILVNLFGDVGVLREENFCISTDSAIQ